MTTEDKIDRQNYRHKNAKHKKYATEDVTDFDALEP